MAAVSSVLPSSRATMASANGFTAASHPGRSPAQSRAGRRTTRRGAVTMRRMIHQGVSVVLAVRDVGATIDRQLGALAAQAGDGLFEVIVSDNGSTDDTLARVQAWSHRLPLRIVDASDRRGSAYARNVGVAASSGARILMCDGDDVVSSSWVSALAGALCTADLATGPYEWAVLNPGLDPLWGQWTADTGVPH